MSTIKDVPKKAGVSPSTASRALNDNSRISLETKQRVRAAAESLGYRLNYAAKNLTSGQSNLVGVVFPVTEEVAYANPFHLDLMRGVAAKLAPHHLEMAVAIGRTIAELLKHVQSLVEHAKVRKMLVFYSVANDPITKYLRSQSIDFVIIGRPDQDDDRYVDSDNYMAGYQATEYLVQQRAVSKPIFILSEHRWSYEEERFRGYQQKMTELGLPSKQQMLITNNQVVGEPIPDFDAIVGSDDLNFLRFVTTHQELCQGLPGLCFNNSRLLSMIMPQVVKVDLLPRQIGAEAVELLFHPQQNHRLVSFIIHDQLAD